MYKRQQYKLDSRIEHLLIDEFQDTNPTQWHLIRPLLEEMSQQAPDPDAPGPRRSVFLVGDAKQSIYRFRGAEPRLFDNASDWLERQLGARRQSLRKSWRSAPAIIDCVNRVFGPDGPLPLPDFETHVVHHAERWGRVTLLPLAQEPEVEDEDENKGRDEAGPEPILRNPLQTPRPEQVEQRHRLEGRSIANTIRELVTTPVLIGDAGAARPVRYRDILILARSRTHIGAIEAALREAGIPYLGAERGTLLDSLEVADLVNLLHWLDMPHDNLALAGVLRSPLFAVDDRDLIDLARAGRGPWLDRLDALAETRPPGSPLPRAAHWLRQWRARIGQVPVHDLLDRIYSEGEVMERFCAAFPPHLGNRVQANLTRFLELALEMDSGRYPSLMRFIQWLKELHQQAREAPDEPVSAGSGDRVRLMTIHAAKGLEAPVVFLADAARVDSANHAWEVLHDWPVDAPRPQRFLLNPPTEARDPLTRDLLEQQRADEAREEANLCYVALTRSRQLLYVSGSQPSKGQDRGWYGKLAAAYDLEPDAIDEPVVLEEAGTPPTAAAPRPAPAVTPVTVDPRLAEPLQLQPVATEIAPSRQLAASEAVGGAVDEDGRLRGIVIHALLEALGAEQPFEPEDIPARLGLSVDPGALASWWQEARAIWQHPELQFLFDPARYQSAWNEVPLQYRQDGRTVYGILDRLVLTETEALVVDYKTHRAATPANLATLAAPYVPQLQYYVAGVRRLWPDRRVRGLLLFTACAGVWEWPEELPD